MKLRWMICAALTDWWRGWTNEDLASALRKTEKPTEPGGIVWLTNPEFKAWVEFSRRREVYPVRAQAR